MMIRSKTAKYFWSKILLACMALMVLSVIGQSSVAKASGFELLRFRLQPVAMLQNNGAKSYSFMGSYDPRLVVADWLAFGLHAGATVFKDAETTKFWALSYQGAIALIPHKNFEAELAGGAQTWTKGGRTKPLVGSNVAYVFDGPLLGFLDRVIAGYHYHFEQSGRQNHQIRLGIGLKF